MAGGRILNNMRHKIVLVDDNLATLDQGKSLLQAFYKVYTVQTAATLFENLEVDIPDLILLDVVMPDYSGFEICRILRESESNNLMPIIMITSKDAQEDILVGLELGADDYVKKPFNERELLSRIRNIFRRIDRNCNANPLTGLGGNMQIHREIQNRISKGLSFAIIYSDLDDFKAYNDAYGFSSGDRIIILTADIIRDQVTLWGNTDDFIGHSGGDDFVVITSTDKAVYLCEQIIAEFDEKIVRFYNDEDRSRGCIMIKNRKGETDTYPLMSISLAIVTNERRELNSPVEAGDIAAEVKKKLKTMAGSNYFLDRRADEPAASAASAGGAGS